jgi:pimeloyl-ACP methyl ester carboxylesterase
MPQTATAEVLRSALARYEQEAVPGVVDAVNYRCRYVAWGEGSPLVIIHGMSDVPRSFAMLMANLVDRHRCIAIELASGHRDGCRYRAYRHWHHVEDLHAVLDGLHLERVDLLGSSFGSTVALRYAANQSERVNRIVLQGGFARRPLKRFERGLARLARYWPGVMRDLIIRPRVMTRFDRPQFEMADPEIYRFFLECSGKPTIQAAARRSLMTHTIDLRPMLPRVTHPLLLFGGDRDPLVPAFYQNELVRLLPNGRRIEFSPCGHYPQYTHAKEMADAMREFLASHPNHGVGP